ncbi:SDR family oxidoreductase [Cryptosporangium arvum]|uniref:Short-chain alcohol dehydrogenase n=1 Tax=Cryptosporangium arvum DSM 44712 TaxID=927661 RepID=A0A011AF53_9ACTN|nr:SDR family oxidoreductase [Cryptosporangium arvum]EXG80661.1 short-chain dehydrogenase of unknown substrate specificity [Cryptosporangium arvum DSM 44712]
MKIAGAVALVTGANRGLGRHFATQLLERGATKVYATARTPESIDIPGVETLRIDVTDPASIEAAAAVAGDVTLLVNNAGISTGTELLQGDLADIRRELETNFYGPLHTVRAFAPVLERNGGGAIVNMLSALSWFAYPGSGAYSAGKAAAWNLTNSIRLELAPRGILVSGVHLGLADTDMAAGLDMPKTPPADVVRTVLDGVEAGALEVVVDEWSAGVKASLSRDPGEFYGDAARPTA